MIVVDQAYRGKKVEKRFIVVCSRERAYTFLLAVFLCGHNPFRTENAVDFNFDGKHFDSRRESSLHSSIKKWYFVEGDRIEAKIDDFIVDIVRGDLLIEIQTANFSAIKSKLKSLLKDHKVRLVYPIPRKKWIVHRSMANGEITGRRMSPKRGSLCDLFSELIRISDLFPIGNLSIEVLMIEVEEIWCNDGKGSWRRKGASIEDRKLLDILESVIFENRTDFLRVLPEDLPNPFTNRNLAENLGISIGQSRKMTYSLRKIGTIKDAGKNRNRMLFQVL